MFLQRSFRNLSMKKAKNQIQLITFEVAYGCNGETAGLHWLSESPKELRSTGRHRGKVARFRLSSSILQHHGEHPTMLCEASLLMACECAADSKCYPSFKREEPIWFEV